MPACCKFIDRKTNEEISLIELDELLCRELKIKPDEKEMCSLYHAICVFGFGVVCSSDKDNLTKEDFDKWSEINKENEYFNKHKHIFERFLLTDFEFQAWYEPKENNEL